MKKLATVFAATAMLFASTAFAADGDNVSAKVKAAFTTDFSGAKQVNWEKTSDFYFASFTLNNVNVDAAYNEEGELIGTSRRIEVAQLPLNVSLGLDKKFNGYTLAKYAIELTYDGETSYYVTAANEKQIVKLKCCSTGEIETESKIKK